LCWNREAPVEANYPTLRARLSEAELTHDAVLAAVISIRRERLPDPVITPNVGSFFKNPVISQQDIDVLRQNFPEVPVVSRVKRRRENLGRVAH
jgi:UDP-N-acetylmuramate dehydrogenase